MTGTAEPPCVHMGITDVPGRLTVTARAGENQRPFPAEAAPQPMWHPQLLQREKWLRLIINSPKIIC